MVANMMNLVLRGLVAGKMKMDFVVLIGLCKWFVLCLVHRILSLGGLSDVVLSMMNVAMVVELRMMNETIHVMIHEMNVN